MEGERGRQVLGLPGPGTAAHLAGVVQRSRLVYLPVPGGAGAPRSALVGWG